MFCGYFIIPFKNNSFKCLNLSFNISAMFSLKILLFTSIVVTLFLYETREIFCVLSHVIWKHKVKNAVCLLCEVLETNRQKKMLFVREFSDFCTQSFCVEHFTVAVRRMSEISVVQPSPASNQDDDRFSFRPVVTHTQGPEF